MMPAEVMKAVASLTGLFFLFGSIEFLLLSRRASFRGIWSDDNLEKDRREGVPLPTGLASFLFSQRLFPLLALVKVLAALGLMIQPGWGWIVALFVAHLMICFRFRGTFNGGSDMMAFVVLTGLLISYGSGNEAGQKLGLFYIALHTGYSYLKAGLVKLLQRDWRSGKALPVFLKRSLLPRARRLGDFLEKRSKLSQVIGWITMLFEVSIVGLLFLPEFRFPYMILAMGFHFGNFVLFGLNRFFWIWLAAWPALLYSLSLLR